MGSKGKRKPDFPKGMRAAHPMLKGFHASQKPNSQRAKRKAGLNNYTEQSNQQTGEQ